MDQRWYETPHGPVPVRLGEFRGRPGLLVIRGTFPEAELFFGLPQALPEADVAIVDLPGMHSPFFAESRPELFAEAFDHVVRQVFPAPPLALGMSMGGLPAFAMTTLCSVIALDTPLTTKGLWPLRDGLKERARQSPGVAAWVWQMFGVSPDGPTLNRDYRPLLSRISVPTRVLVADEPLNPKRPLLRIPSLVSTDDRAAYQAAGVRLTDVRGSGHNIPAAALSGLLGVLRETLAGLPNLHRCVDLNA